MPRSPFALIDLGPAVRGAAAALVVATLVSATTAAARPVGYRGGVTATALRSVGEASAEATYAPSPRYAVGLRFERDRGLAHDFVGPALNVLALRHNAADSQANLYLTGAVGLATGRYVRPTALSGPLSIHEAHLAALSGGGAPGAPAPLRYRRAAVTFGAQADWESRRFLVMAEARRMMVEQQGKTTMYRGRIGVAPYVAEYGGLHTWLIVQAEHYPFAGRKFTVTPLLRIFKGSTLVEAGSSLEGELLATISQSF